METNEKWYIRGKIGFAEQIKQEFIKRGIEEVWFTPALEDPDYIFFPIEGVMTAARADGTVAARMLRNWEEVKIESKQNYDDSFQPFDKVLVCNGEGEYWFATFFSCYCMKVGCEEVDEDRPYFAVDGELYKYCKHYEENEYLNCEAFKPEHVK